MKRLLAVLTAAVGMVVSIAAQSATVGYYLSNTGGSPAAAITASGNTPLQLNNLTAGDLAGIDVLWILNGSNGNPDNNVLSNQAAISAFVNGGGVLSFHDRGVTNAANYLPGAAGVSFVRDLASDVDVLANNLVTNGPAGVIGNTTLDGGNFTNHGYATLGSLPAGAVGVLNVGGFLDRIVDFYYPLGAGDVYYSAMPLDFYLAGAGNNPPGDAYRNIYAVNEAAFQVSLAGQVPVPATIVLLAMGLGAMTMRRRAA